MSIAATHKQKRILFLTPNYSLGSEVWMRRQAEGLSAFDVQVVCNRFFDSPGVRKPIVLSRSFVRRVLTKFRVSGPVADRLCACRFRVGSNARVDRCERSGWAKILSEFAPDVALVHYGMQAVRYGRLLYDNRVPFAVHFNGLDLSRKLNDGRYVRELKQVLPLAAKLVVVADYMQDWLLSNGAREEQVVKIPYGTPVDESHSVSDSSSADAPVKFLMVGRLTAKKAPVLTIEAFLTVAAENAAIELDVIGDGELKAQVAEFVASHDKGHKVKLHGAQPFTNVKTALQNADVFLQHSLTPSSGDREGWPVAIAEAAAFGLPIVSTNHASIPEQVLDGQTGYIVPERDLEGMASAIQKLATDGELRSEMSKRARSHMATFHVDHQIELLQNLLLDIARV